MAWLLHTCPLYQSLVFFCFYQETNLVHLRLWAGLASISNTLFPLYYWIIQNNLQCLGFGLFLNDVILCLSPLPPFSFEACVCTYQKMTNFHTTKSSGFPSLLCTVSSLRLLDVASLCTWLVSLFLIKALLQFIVLDFLISCILLLFARNFSNMLTLCI